MAKRRGEKKGPSQRQLRAGELIRHALVEIIQREDMREPALQNISITISEVRVTPDLKSAIVYATPLGGARQGEVVDALNRAAPFLRSALGRNIDLKFTPKLTFRNDETFDEANKIDSLLARPEVSRDLSGD